MCHNLSTDSQLREENSSSRVSHLHGYSQDISYNRTDGIDALLKDMPAIASQVASQQDHEDIDDNMSTILARVDALQSLSEPLMRELDHAK
jgi:hypothetical protein